MPDGDIFGLKSGNLGGDISEIRCIVICDQLAVTVGHLYGLSYLKISGNNQVENIF